MIYALALAIGIVAGLRTMTAAAAIGWAAHLHRLALGDLWLTIIGGSWTVWILTALAAAELVTDQLPTTPSRKSPVAFGARIAIGAIAGAALGIGHAMPGGLAAGIALGVAGAVIGTLGGAALRMRLAIGFGNDRPAALLEDAIAIGGAVLIVAAL